MSSAAEQMARAVVRHRAGDLAGAEQGYRQVLADDPRHAKAWKMLGVLSRDSGRTREAAECLEAALECAGPEPRLFFHLGQTHAQARNLDGAIRAYGQSLALHEADAKVHHALGLALVRRDCPHEAGEHFRRAIELDSSASASHFCLAVTLAAAGDAAAAEAAYRRLLTVCPDHAQALSNLGSLLADRGRQRAALACFRRAVACDPDCAEAQFNLAAALTAAGQLAEARRPLERGLALRDGHMLWALRAAAPGEQIFADNSEIDAYRAQLAGRLGALADRRWQLDPAEMPVPGSQPPAALIYQGREDKRLKIRYAGLLASRLPVGEPPRRSGKPCVGFVVTPGHEGVFLRGMAGVLNLLDIRKMDVTLFCGRGAETHVAARLQNPGVRRATLPRDALRAVHMLREAQCDLLYYWEVGTDALNYCLPFFRPAPVQCTSWGWPVTSGIAAMDYFISSRQLEPPDAADHYSEQLIQLAEIPNYYYRPDLTHVAADRERFGFAAAEHIYLCPQNPRKFHPDFDRLIGEILRADPQGIFVLLAAEPAWLSDALVARFARTLSDVAERIRIVPRVTKSRFMTLLASADVVLDTPHYGGGANTTLDALALAKPLVTLLGAQHRGRYAAAACRSIGLAELIADSPADYIRKAVELGTQPERRKTTADRIRAAADVLFERRPAVAELEGFLLDVIERRRAG